MKTGVRKMALLSVSNLSKSYGSRTIFENVSFTIEENHQIGFVGENGSGKTTLFKVICGELFYDTGEIYKSKNLKIGYVEQFLCKNSVKTVWEELLTIQSEFSMQEEKIQALQEQIELLSIRGNQNEELTKLIAQKHEEERKYEEAGGYTYKSIARSTLLGLGFEEKELALEVKSLSGGQKTKLALAKLLLSHSNLLLLDEPTNNLDIDSMEWLENFLLNFKGSYMVISHDRYFLDKVTKETVELEAHKLNWYKGNYTTYVQLKAEKNKTIMRKYEATQKEINRLEKVIKQQETWSMEHNYKTIRNKQKSIDRLENEMVEPAKEKETMKFHFVTISGGNREVLVVKDICKSYAHKLLFSHVNCTIYKGEKVFLVGPNGCGKTTFLKIIQGLEKADSGEYLVGSHVQIAYYSQQVEEVTGSQTILENVWEQYPKLTQTEIRKALARFLFKGEDVFKELSSLSGGEKARVALLKMLLSQSNFLILDEPTNHLDILARESLENALQEYEGTMLIVSHDRYFMNKLANKIYTFGAEGSKEYDGNYDFYLQQRTIGKDNNTYAKPKNISYQEKKAKEALARKKAHKIQMLEEQIEKNEKAIQELEALTMEESYATDYEKIMEITKQIDALKKENESNYEEWMSINEE